MTEITQADQDAAVEWYSPRESEWTGLLAEAFARHREYGYHQGYYDGRTMTEAETVAKIVAWIEYMYASVIADSIVVGLQDGDYKQ